MKSNALILVVDSSAENRDVLRTLLERQGAEILETPRSSQASDLARARRPDVIVYDAEADGDPSPEAVRNLDRAASPSSTPIVVLGTKRQSLSRLTTGHFISKPYHYATLIRRIGELLGNRFERRPSLSVS